jgi:hypothetical protein
MVQAGPAVPVQVLDQRSAERDRLREPAPDRLAGRDKRNVMRAQDRGDQIVRIERSDQLDLMRARERDGSAGPDGDAEVVCTAQNGRTRRADHLADLGGRHAHPLVKPAKGFGGHHSPVLAIPAAATASPDAIAAEPVTDGPFRHTGHRGNLPRAQFRRLVQLGDEPSQVGRIGPAAHGPATADPTRTHGHAGPVKRSRYPLPVPTGELGNLVSRQLTAQVEVNQPFWRPVVQGGFLVRADSTIGTRRIKIRGATVRHKKRPPARIGQGPLAMTAFDGGPLRRIQLQDKYRLRVSKGRRDGGDPGMYSKN